MKLRISGNSLRLRLTGGEVEQFGKIGRITETIQFGASATAVLSYTLETSNQAENISANFAGSHITVTIPDAQARNWIETVTISLKVEQSIESNSTKNVLIIMIEKDFASR